MESQEMTFMVNVYVTKGPDGFFNARALGGYPTTRDDVQNVFQTPLCSSRNPMVAASYALTEAAILVEKLGPNK